MKIWTRSSIGEKDPLVTVPNDRQCGAVSMVLDAPLISRCFGILQRGFFVKASVGISVGEMLSDQLELPAEWVSEKISTVFLDGKPVDDLDEAVVREGCTLALSSSVPGLAGAAMRRKGFYAPFRNSITHEKESAVSLKKEGLFRVKLFSLVMAELGPIFFKKGFYLSSGEFASFLTDQSESFFAGLQKVVLDGQSAPPDTLKNAGFLGNKQWVNLTICELR